jgi:5'-nucleotidase
VKILISNDDGLDSPGIRALAKVMEPLGDVVVVAPHRERSTAGHSLTLHKPLRIMEQGNGVYSTSGTPADCIYLGIREILKTPPDLILSGINRGANLGTDVHYSGTVAAAREGALMDIPSYAFSMVDLHQIFVEQPSQELRFDVGAHIARLVVEQTQTLKFPPHTLLNVNIPNTDLARIKGIRVTRQGFRYYQNEVTQRRDPRGNAYYWIGGPYLGFHETEDSDCLALNEGFVAVTPLTIDCTHNHFYTTLKDIPLNL